jgi:hypothetical protein
MGVVCFFAVWCSGIYLIINSIVNKNLESDKFVVGIIVTIFIFPALISFGNFVKSRSEMGFQCLEMSGKIDSGSCIIKGTKFEFDQLADLKKAIELKKVVDKITEGK